MTERYQVYKCEGCGNIIEVLHGAKGILKCSNQRMILQKEKKEDLGNEKHVPIIERTEKGIKVKVGSVAHPMVEEHYNEWIEVIANGQSYRKFLNPGDQPEAEFDIGPGEVQAREYCSIHGLWKG